MNFRWLFLFLVILIPSLLLGQNDTKILSLDDCIQLALENNYQLNLAKLDNQISKKNYLQSYSNILPQVDVRYSGSKYERGPSSYLGGEFVGENPNLPFTFEVTTGRNYFFGADVEQTIFDGGRWYLNIKRSGYDKERSSFVYQSSRQNVIVSVQQLYFDLLKQKKLFEVRQQAVERSQKQLERVQSMYEVGSVAQVDVFRSEVNLGNDRIELLNQENNLREARESLNIAIGREPASALEIENDIQYEKDVDELDEVVQTAISNNPDLRAQEFNVKSTKYGVRIAQSAFLPNIGGFFSYDRRVPQFSGLYEEFDREYQWSVGIGLSWNLFNGFNDYLGVQKSKINHKYAKEQLAYDKLNLKSRVSNLYHNLEALNEIISINKTNLESAQEDYRLAQERYRLGSGTLLDLRDAQVNLARAEQILVAAEFDSYITHAELQQALGELVDASK